MKFVFLDKHELEADIITKILAQEKIPFKTKCKLKQLSCENNCSCDDDKNCENCDGIFIEIYEIASYTDLEHFEFIKAITEKEIENINMLNKCYYKSSTKIKKKQLNKIHSKE